MDDIKIKVLYKALKVLDCFDKEHGEYGVTELASLCNTPKSTMYNILVTFEKCGYFMRTPSNRYCLSTKFLRLSNVFYHANDIRSLIRPMMQSLCEQFHLIIYLGIPYSTSVLYLEGIFPTEATYTNMTVGKQEPMHSTGLGKVMLAYMGGDVLQMLEKESLRAYTENTITDINKLREELEIIKKRSYAIDNMENIMGICCVAVPLFDSSGELVGAISISGSHLQVTAERIPTLGQALLATSRHFSELYR